MGPVIKTEEHWISDRIHIVIKTHTDGISIEVVKLTSQYNFQSREIVQQFNHSIEWGNLGKQYTIER